MTAETHGLEIAYHAKYGWTITTPALSLLEYIEIQGWQPIQMTEGVSWWDMCGTGTASSGVNGKETGAEKPPKRPSSTRKYVCPQCGNSCRATKEINLICADCMAAMVDATS
ncbi:MAG: hypothetical protein RR709_10330 [Ruthenibacterium sp.]